MSAAGRKFEEFDRSRLKIAPLNARKHGLDIRCITALEPRTRVSKNLRTVAKRIAAAHIRSSAVVLMMGAHVIRSGVQRYVIDMVERGFISCVALNGAGVIHDFELALFGATTENVAYYIRDGRFGLWQETGQINDIVKEGVKKGMGLGECVGAAIAEEKFPQADLSILGSARRCGVPVTVHVGIGYDIIAEHPNYDGAAFGEASYRDFLRLVKVMESLEGGVVMNFGSAVMGPEVYLKALAMVRNAAAQQGRRIANFTTLVCDLKELPETYHIQPTDGDDGYHFRPWKTMLVRTVAEGGESFYVQGRHEQTIPELWTAITSETRKNRRGRI